ncbi:MAG: HAMP domain-containing protein [Candidatus Omnitrophica bacterium]|nr:HAMP domain-containing protein [Candidatus Omnitrophota bacterium]
MESSRFQQPNLLRMFIICFLVVSALFFGYEIVERIWLKGVGTEVIHVLHIIRGFSAAAIASLLAALLLLRQTHDITSDVILSPPERSWKHRLQHVRLRTKIVSPMVALAIIPAITIGIFTISRMQNSLREGAIQRVEFDTASKARAVEEFLNVVQQDLRFLSQIKEIQELVTAETAGSPDMIEALRQKVEQEFLIFSQGKRAYYQVRYMNSAGYEVVRLNVENGLPQIVPYVQLQDKSNRYYVKAALTIEPGQIYVSPMDLNIEYGKVELPPLGVVRYAIPVLGEKGVGRGLLIINIYAHHLLSIIEPIAPGVEAWLVDHGGTYLGYVGESEERRNLFSLEKQRHLSRDYTPEQIRAILPESGGGQLVKTGRDFLSSASMAIDQQDSQRRWTLMIGHPKAPIEQPIRHLTTFLMVVVTFVIAVAAILGMLIGDYLVRPIVRLQHATRDIAAGDLEKHLNITTGDEIEKLANDFNTMTQHLRQAREHLSEWNLELKREVERQTEMLHQIQSGMARADKLASIGQITAGVLHEVGNPLAAIKTKIQVAGEDKDLCKECHGLLTEIIREVDRLAAFLHSFSRLARLGGDQIKENVSLSEVTQSVVRLVSADLRKKGMILRCEVAKDTPNVHGVADQLRQLLMNLILNAADASRDGGEIVVKIQRFAPAPGPAGASGIARLEVIDKGEGISPDILDRIWDPFFTTKHEGTGLGLAICRQIVQDHGGTIKIDSEPGKGTVVAVTFPETII